MSEVTLQVSGIKKVFQRKAVLSGITISVSQSRSFAITGRNGSGKSTLLKIIAGLLTPTAGEVQITIDGRQVFRDDVFSHIGFVAPYLQLYDEFTAWENLDIARKLRCLSIPDDRLNLLLERVNLAPRKDDLVRTFSSGMKQRLKYAHALLHRPAVLLLDEPTSNLDTDGVQIVHQLIAVQRTSGIVILATNVQEELSLCEDVLDLDSKQIPGKVAS